MWSAFVPILGGVASVVLMADAEAIRPTGGFMAPNIEQSAFEKVGCNDEVRSCTGSRSRART
jgi:hypothetical protein